MEARGRAIDMIFGLLAIMALIEHDLEERRRGAAVYKAAQAIAGGYANEESSIRPLPEEPHARADQIRADELDAGAAWAKLHHAQSAADCPKDSATFLSGCIAAMRGEWPSSTPGSD